MLISISFVFFLLQMAAYCSDDSDHSDGEMHASKRRLHSRSSIVKAAGPFGNVFRQTDWAPGYPSKPGFFSGPMYTNTIPPGATAGGHLGGPTAVMLDRKERDLLNVPRPISYARANTGDLIVDRANCLKHHLHFVGVQTNDHAFLDEPAGTVASLCEILSLPGLMAKLAEEDQRKKFGYNFVKIMNAFRCVGTHYETELFDKRTNQVHEDMFTQGSVVMNITNEGKQKLADYWANMREPSINGTHLAVEIKYGVNPKAVEAKQDAQYSSRTNAVGDALVQKRVYANPVWGLSRSAFHTRNTATWTMETSGHAACLELFRDEWGKTQDAKNHIAQAVAAAGADPRDIAAAEAAARAAYGPPAAAREHQVHVDHRGYIIYIGVVHDNSQENQTKPLLTTAEVDAIVNPAPGSHQRILNTAHHLPVTSILFAVEDVETYNRAHLGSGHRMGGDVVFSNADLAARGMSPPHTLSPYTDTSTSVSRLTELMSLLGIAPPPAAGSAGAAVAAPAAAPAPAPAAAAAAGPPIHVYVASTARKVAPSAGAAAAAAAPSKSKSRSTDDDEEDDDEDNGRGLA
jgi:hypothetical protein